jgi:hypothetical protein
MLKRIVIAFTVLFAVVLVATPAVQKRMDERQEHKHPAPSPSVSATVSAQGEPAWTHTCVGLSTDTGCPDETSPQQR